MKLSLILGDVQKTIEWNRDLSDFPHVVKFGDKYWQWVSWDDDPAGLVHKVLFFGTMREEALAIDIHGVPFPVPDLQQMFNFGTDGLACECGAKFTSFPGHHMVSCPKWSKP